jgi:hypothetical protein
MEHRAVVCVRGSTALGQVDARRAKRVSILLSKTREENAEKFVTRADVHSDINRVLVRLDRLDEKLDAFIKEQRSALS